MGKIKVITDLSLKFIEGYVVLIKIYEVKRNLKYPEGFKAKFALISKAEGKIKLVIDNHAPFGFHVHEFPNLDVREKLNIKNHRHAEEEFWRRVWKQIKK